MVQPELKKGTFFDIQGFSVHDGPGCRTLIFFKGCSLSCAWCCNPEGINAFPEPLYNASKCSFDENCIRACPYEAIVRNGDSVSFDRLKCRDCATHNCISVCYTGALRLGGYDKNAEELFSIIQRDRQYWGSEGGITLTGGEPFLQPETARDILKWSYDAYIHTAVETCANVPWKNIEPSLPYTDWIFFDLKQTDDRVHRQWTSKGNRQILDNARRLAREFNGRLIFRLPVVPGFNDDTASLAGIADFILSLGKNEINILPLHHLGKEKYALVGKKYFTADLILPSVSDLQTIQSSFLSKGITCYVGSRTPF